VDRHTPETAGPIVAGTIELIRNVCRVLATGREKRRSRIRLDGHRAESYGGQSTDGNREAAPVSLRLDIATIAKIEADRIYHLIPPEMGDQETVTVPLPFLENMLTTGQKLEEFAPAYVTRALDRLEGSAKVQRFRKKAVVPKESLAFVAAAFRKAAESAQGQRP
jgi:hypothetical protein